jgi:serine/threonine protein kinase
VLRPEIAVSLGSDRFFREIEVAAQLQHPHILPLLDSGEAGGFYYYVMPLVEGESLRERLTRHGELPIHDAVKVLIEVVDGWPTLTAGGWSIATSSRTTSCSRAGTHWLPTSGSPRR